MKILVTGCCGFIGHTAYKYFEDSGHDMCGIDNLSRMGSVANMPLIDNLHIVGLEEIDEVEAVVEDFMPDVVLHYAAQVAVTTSMKDPVTDFLYNVVGTFNLLECCRHLPKPPMFLYASTNKVYTVHNLDIIGEKGGPRYEYRPTVEWGPQTPYGVSKGCADMYVREYGLTYGMETCCFRQSCIYGATQNTATEDQGWVAFIVKQYMAGETINVFGTGKQVRDLLYVDDLVKAYECVMLGGVKSPYYDMGGGWDNTLSVNELLKWLFCYKGFPEEVLAEGMEYKGHRREDHDWRPHDQKVYVADIARFCADYDWTPTVSVDEGLRRLVESNR